MNDLLTTARKIGWAFEGRAYCPKHLHSRVAAQGVYGSSGWQGHDYPIPLLGPLRWGTVCVSCGAPLRSYPRPIRKVKSL